MICLAFPAAIVPRLNAAIATLVTAFSCLKFSQFDCQSAPFFIIQSRKAKQRDSKALLFKWLHTSRRVMPPAVRQRKMVTCAIDDHPVYSNYTQLNVCAQGARVQSQRVRGMPGNFRSTGGSIDRGNDRRRSLPTKCFLAAFTQRNFNDSRHVR